MTSGWFFFPECLNFSRKSVTQMTILTFILISHMYAIAKKPVSWLFTPPLGALQLKEKTWEVKGERKELGENQDEDRYRWVVRAQMFLENNSRFEKQTSDCSPTHRHLTSCSRL